jgi:hypothetical protein
MQIVKAIIGMLWTALDCQTEYCARVYKVLYAGEKAEAKKVFLYCDLKILQSLGICLDMLSSPLLCYLLHLITM